MYLLIFGKHYLTGTFDLVYRKGFMNAVKFCMAFIKIELTQAFIVLLFVGNVVG